jgi:uncharacterized protein (DUF2267 family)
MNRIAELDDALTTAEFWVDAVTERLGWHDRRKAFRAFVAALHALRDSLPMGEAVYLGAELPTLIRGLYYDGWHPNEKPGSIVERSEFLDRIHESLHRDPAVDAEQTARDVLAELARHLPAGELEDVKAATPKTLRSLWAA